MVSREFYPENLSLLKRIYRQSCHHQVRQRAQCLLLKAEGLRVSQLAVIFQVQPKTIYNWLNAWNERGMAGLYNRPGRGRKAKLNPEQKEQIRAWVEQEPKQLKKVAQKAQETWGIGVSIQTIKRVR